MRVLLAAFLSRSPACAMVPCTMVPRAMAQSNAYAADARAWGAQAAIRLVLHTCNAHA